MDMDVEILEDLLVDAQFFRTRLGEREGRLGRFLHHLAELAREHQLALASCLYGLDEQDVASDGGPGEPGHGADLVLFQGAFAENARHAEVFADIFGRDADRFEFRFQFSLLPGHLAADLSYLALEVPQAGFLGVLADDLRYGLSVETYVVLSEAVFFDLLRDEAPFSDLKLFFFGVAGQRNDLHPVP